MARMGGARLCSSARFSPSRTSFYMLQRAVRGSGKENTASRWNQDARHLLPGYVSAQTVLAEGRQSKWIQDLGPVFPNGVCKILKRGIIMMYSKLLTTVEVAIL